MDPDSRSFSLQKLGPDPHSEKLLGPDPQKMKKDLHLVLVPCFCLNVATRDFELARKYGFLFTVPIYGILRFSSCTYESVGLFYESFLYKPKVGSESAFLIHITDWKQNNSDPHS